MRYALIVYVVRISNFQFEETGSSPVESTIKNNMMELNDLKKLLYRNSVQAELIQVNKSGIVYHSNFYEDKESIHEISVSFVVPLNDIGDAHFHTTMYAKHLIRYIDIFNKEK
jgi:hypothetical protein